MLPNELRKIINLPRDTDIAVASGIVLREIKYRKLSCLSKVRGVLERGNPCGRCSAQERKGKSADDKRSDDAEPDDSLFFHRIGVFLLLPL